MEPTEEDSVPLRHGVGGGKAPSSSAPQWLPRKLPMHISDVALKMAVFALFVCQVMTWRELRYLNANPSPQTPKIIPFPPLAPPTNGSSKAEIEYKIVSWDETHLEGCSDVYLKSIPEEFPKTILHSSNPQWRINHPHHLCMCSGKPCNKVSSCAKCSYEILDYTEPDDYKGHCKDDEPGYAPKFVSVAKTSTTSFIDVAKREGLTDKDIFTDCLWPTYTETFTKFWNYSRVHFWVPSDWGVDDYSAINPIDCGQGLVQHWSGLMLHAARDMQGVCYNFQPQLARAFYDTCLAESDEPKTFTYGSSWANASHTARSCVLQKLMTKMNKGNSSLRLLYETR